MVVECRDPATQKQVKQTASAPSLNDQGDIAIKKLAGDDSQLLQTDAPTDKSALKEWADSQALKAGLARYRGTFSFYGAAEAVPGCIIELKGLGKRFNGKVYVGSVTHTIEKNEWITKVGMGVPAIIIKGSATVMIGGKPAARMGDTTAHGGSIVMGCPTVIIGG